LDHLAASLTGQEIKDLCLRLTEASTTSLRHRLGLACLLAILTWVIFIPAAAIAERAGEAGIAPS
jgi:hypothetical protein